MRNLLIEFLARRERELTAVTCAQQSLSPSPVAFVKRTCEMVRRQVLERRVGLELKTPRYASLLTIVIDSAAIFTTRDWSAIGALSAAAAVVGLDMQAERDG